MLLRFPIEGAGRVPVSAALSARTQPGRGRDSRWPVCSYDAIRPALSRRSVEQGAPSMCRSIKTLANFEPPATDDEIQAAALQFVRKLSGTVRPARANEAAFNRAVEEIAEAAHRLIDALETNAAPRNREEEARKARERSLKRFG